MKKMSCENCKGKVVDEVAAVKATSEVAQRYKLLSKAVVALSVAFFLMVGCCVWVVVNAQRIANEAVLEALYTVAEMEVTTETTTTTQTVEGDSATINNVDGEQYNDNATNGGDG